MKRTGLLGCLWLASVAAACIALLPLKTTHAQTKPLQKARLLVATGVFDVTYSEFTLPSILGYWRDEGYDVEARGAYLLVKAVPYVTATREVRRGTLLTDLVMAGPGAGAAPGP